MTGVHVLTRNWQIEMLPPQVRRPCVKGKESLAAPGTYGRRTVLQMGRPDISIPKYETLKLLRRGPKHGYLPQTDWDIGYIHIYVYIHMYICIYIYMYTYRGNIGMQGFRVGG